MVLPIETAGLDLCHSPNGQARSVPYCLDKECINDVHVPGHREKRRFCFFDQIIPGWPIHISYIDVRVPRIALLDFKHARKEPWARTVDYHADKTIGRR